MIIIYLLAENTIVNWKDVKLSNTRTNWVLIKEKSSVQSISCIQSTWKVAGLEAFP